MTSTLIGFAAVLSAAVWAVVVWLVAVAVRDDRRRDDFEIRPGPGAVAYGDVRAQPDAPAPAPAPAPAGTRRTDRGPAVAPHRWNGLRGTAGRSCTHGTACPNG